MNKKIAGILIQKKFSDIFNPGFCSGFAGAISIFFLLLPYLYCLTPKML